MILLIVDDHPQMRRLIRASSATWLMSSPNAVTEHTP
jgi:hypothetical protein